MSDLFEELAGADGADRPDSLSFEIRALLAEARASVETAEELVGEPRRRRAERAVAAAQRVLDLRPQEPAAREIHERATALVTRGLAERSRADRRFALRRAGVVTLLAGLLVVSAAAVWIDAERRDAVAAREAAERASVLADRRTSETRRAFSLLNRLLHDGGSSADRRTWTGPIGTGLELALEDGLVHEVFFFLESGRVGPLERLLRRDRPAAGGETAALDARAAGKEREAVAAFAAARASGSLSEAREARRVLGEARAERLTIVRREQREADRRGGARSLSTVALEEAQGLLEDGEALVLYGVLPERGVAVVATEGGARVVRLAGEAEIADAVAALPFFADGRDDGAAAIETLAALAVEPLSLGPEVRRVLVSPDGPLASAPFSLLFPDREVVHVPSAACYSRLLDTPDEGVGDVLALGDPDYERGGVPPPALRLRGGPDLFPLPATREEALAVGTVVLLGRDASERRLREELARDRAWRAVHLACHTLVDEEQPMLSSLALASGSEDDGFLTALEIFRLRFSADLVTVSGCDAARARPDRSRDSEGLVGALLFAGARRVLANLWKVDDEATLEFMREFYARFQPRDGSAPRSAADSLVEASRALRDGGRYSSPRHWAGWTLWGRGD